MVVLSRRRVLAAAACILAGNLAGCTSDPPGEAPALRGAGATFPAPLYEIWFREFGKLGGGTVEYKAVGSGEGKRRFLRGETDFGASDVPLDDAEIVAAPHGALLIPATAAPIALAYRIDGLQDGLRLSREIVADLFLGKISRWNDPRIAAANPGVKLPDLPVTLAVRHDASGTTYAFTRHLSETSRACKDSIGVADRVQFPGRAVEVDGNDGVARLIKSTAGAIGYVVLRTARGAGLPTARLENKAGKFVMPSERSGAAAVSAALLDAQLRTELPDPAGDDSYPIVAFTWLLLPTKVDDPAKAAALQKLVGWCLTDGQDLSERHDFIPLSAGVVKAALQALHPTSGR